VNFWTWNFSFSPAGSSSSLIKLSVNSCKMNRNQTLRLNQVSHASSLSDLSQQCKKQKWEYRVCQAFKTMGHRCECICSPSTRNGYFQSVPQLHQTANQTLWQPAQKQRCDNISLSLNYASMPTIATVCSLSHKPCHLTDSHTPSRLKPNFITVQELYTHI
jgi:hypothetical protein